MKVVGQVLEHRNDCCYKFDGSWALPELIQDFTV